MLEKVGKKEDTKQSLRARTRTKKTLTHEIDGYVQLTRPTTHVIEKQTLNLGSTTLFAVLTVPRTRDSLQLLLEIAWTNPHPPQTTYTSHATDHKNEINPSVFDSHPAQSSQSKHEEAHNVPRKIHPKRSRSNRPVPLSNHPVFSSLWPVYTQHPFHYTLARGLTTTHTRHKDLLRGEISTFKIPGCPKDFDSSPPANFLSPSPVGGTVRAGATVARVLLPTHPHTYPPAHVPVLEKRS